MRLANNTSTFADECAADGKDWEEVFAQRARENERMKELGLTAPDITPEPANKAPEGQEENANEE
jgi:capsid protein